MASAAARSSLSSLQSSSSSSWPRPPPPPTLRVGGLRLAPVHCIPFAGAAAAELPLALHGPVASMEKRSVGDMTAAELKGKNVFVRADLNVALDEKQKVVNDSKIRAAVPTIKHLILNSAKVILSGHLDHSKGVRLEYNSAPVVTGLSELLGVQLQIADDHIHPEVEKMLAALPQGGVVLLENVRLKEDLDDEFVSE